MWQRVSPRRFGFMLLAALTGVILISALIVTVSATVGTGIAAVDTPVKAAVAETQDRASFNETAFRAHVHQELNERRQTAGQQPVAQSEALQRTAQAHTEELLNRSYFGYLSQPNRSLIDRYEEFRVIQSATDTCTARETIYWSTDLQNAMNEASFAETVVDHWMQSSAGNSKLLNPQVSEVGVGVSIGEVYGERRVIVAQNFC